MGVCQVERNAAKVGVQPRVGPGQAYAVRSSARYSERTVLDDPERFFPASGYPGRDDYGLNSISVQSGGAISNHHRHAVHDRRKRLVEEADRQAFATVDHIGRVVGSDAPRKAARRRPAAAGLSRPERLGTVY